MASTTPQLIARVRQRCSVENNQVVTDDELLSYLNEALKSLYDLIIATDPSYYESSADFTLASSPTGSAGALPADFYRMRGLVRYPDTTREYPVFLRPFSERRRGGNAVEAGYTLDGNNITVVPWSIAGDGPWRLYYTPKAPQVGYDATVVVATVQALPAYTTGGGLLTATANGALVIDGVTNPATVLVKNESATSFNNYDVLLQAGDGTHPWILGPGSITAGFRVKATSGAFNVNKIYTFSTSPVANAWPEQGLDVTLDNFDEYLINKAALDVFAKRQMDPGMVTGLFSSAEERVRGMAAGRASEPEQAPVMWRGRRGRYAYDDLDNC
jgi:hypothetical protein